MNLEAVLLTLIFAAAVFGAAALLGTSMVWANKVESRVFRSILGRTDGRGSPPEDYR